MLIKKIADVKRNLERGQSFIQFFKNIMYIFMSVSLMKSWALLAPFATFNAFIILTILFIVVTYLIGYLDLTKIKLYQHERVSHYEVNPVTQDIINRLDRIEKNIK